MPDTIETRLRETSSECLECYTKWSDNKKDLAAREGMQSAVHELRKVASRLEIELAVSEREGSQRPIDPPAHKTHKNSGRDSDNKGKVRVRRPRKDNNEAQS